MGQPIKMSFTVAFYVNPEEGLLAVLRRASKVRILADKLGFHVGPIKMPTPPRQPPTV